MAGNGHDPFVVESLPDLHGYEGMPQVVKAEAVQSRLLTGRVEGPFPSLTHGFAAPGEDMATNGSHLPFPLLFPDVVKDGAQGRGDRNGPFLVRLRVYRRQPQKTHLEVDLVPCQISDFSGAHTDLIRACDDTLTYSFSSF